MNQHAAASVLLGDIERIAVLDVVEQLQNSFLRSSSSGNCQNSTMLAMAGVVSV
jgi:hypothetical protein